MPVELDVEEAVIVWEERYRLASERLDRNALAIEEVVGRNPAKKPATIEVKPSAPKPRG